MAKNSGKQQGSGKLNDGSDALFKLPLAEFIAARKTLAAELKKAGRVKEADYVKTLAKPSISAWAANQLYWQHREAFDELIATGQRFREAQTSGRAGKVADMREALDARREALAHLSDLATAVLRAAGSSPTPETVHRITTTLEAMSAYASLPDAQRPGRLSRDVDPPGFESFASLIPGAGMTIKEERVVSPPKPAAAASTRRKAESASEPSRAEQTRQAKIAAAKVSLQEAKSLLSEARAKAQSLETAQKKADADAKQAEKQKREAEERFEKARVAAQDAARSARYLAAEAEAAAKAVEVAKRSVDRSAKELEKLFGQ